MNADIEHSDYYEKTDFSEHMKNSVGTRQIRLGQTKRITINITKATFDEAHELDASLGMGYQNVLKTAMFIGLKQLREKAKDVVSAHLDR